MAARRIGTGHARRAGWPLLPVVAAALALSGCSIFDGGDPETTPTIGNRKPVLSRIESDAKVDEALALVSVVLPPAEANADWPQPGGNAAKAVGHLAIGDNPARAWTARVAGASQRVRLAAAPVAANGSVYAIDTQARVHALDLATGAVRWQASLAVDGDGAQAVFGGGVSIDSGRVFATTGVGEVAAFDAATGNPLWRTKPAGPLRGAPTVAFNALYVMTQDNQIYSLDVSDGTPLWQEAASAGQAGVFGVAAPAAAQGTVVAGYSSGELVAYRYENGRNLWADALARTSIATSVATLSDIDADPIIDRGRVFALGQGGRMAAYELVTGQRIWELNLAGISTPAIAGEWIFALTDDARLLCIARTSGKVRWMSQLDRYRDMEDREGEISWSGPVLAGGRLFVTGSDGRVMSVDAGDGSARLLTELGNPVSLPPIVADRTLIILDDSGTITAFR